LNEIIQVIGKEAGKTVMPPRLHDTAPLHQFSKDYKFFAVTFLSGK